MRYKRFEFRNFKGIKNLVLDLEGAVTTLIGLNESGKTTILEAIFCFSYGAESIDALDPSMASLRDPERWVPISQRGNFNDAIEIVAHIELDAADRDAYTKAMREQFDVRVDSPPPRITITEKYLFENSRMKSQSKTWSLQLRGTKGKQRSSRPFGATSPEWRGAVNWLKSQLPAIWYFPNFLFELPERFDLVTPPPTGAAGAEELDEKNAFYRLTFDRILAQLGTGANVDTHIINRLQSADRADRRNLTALLLEMGREITKTVFDGWNRIFGRPPTTAQEVALDADVDESGKAFLELKIKGPDGYFDLAERSLGFRWFFMFLLMTSYRGLSHGRSGVVFLLDEPASNLHSSAQAELLKSFATLAESCQLIYATHSQHMINVQWLDAALVVANAALGDLTLDAYLTTISRGSTSISATPYRRFVAENPSRTSYFQPVLDVLDYQPAAIELVPNVVLVEGKSDFFCLKYLIEVLELASPNFGLVPGTGAGTLDTAVRLYVGWARSFAILLDGDKEGKKQRDRYMREFGPLVSGRCCLVPELLTEPDIEEIEDLFEDADKLALVRAARGAGAAAPTKKSFLGAVQELYARNEAVSLSIETIDRARTLVARLSELVEPPGIEAS